MTVEQPAFERVRSVSELQTFVAHFNPLNAELNPICHLLALLGARHILHVSRIRVKLQCLYICFIPCFIVTDISGYISINRITNSEHVIDKINKKVY